MSIGLSLQSPHELRIYRSYAYIKQSRISEFKGHALLLNASLSSCASRQDIWNLKVSNKIYKPVLHSPPRYNIFTCHSLAHSGSVYNIPAVLKLTALALKRSYNTLISYPHLVQLVPAFGVTAFAVWGLGPLLRFSRIFFLHRNDSNWKKSRTHYLFTSYLQPVLLWTGVILICRALDPIVLTPEASQVVKQRLLNFGRSLSTVLAFAYCLSSLIQQTQKFFIESNPSNDARTMGFQFAGKAVYSAVWVAAISLFMELLGFSTQKWLTAGGLGTVLLTLAGREIFTNFLSSLMIHATRPFVMNEWIQTKIEGYEVSGFVEHVGWWSPTIIRGEDREAIHIPNHKFTVNVVRNLSQKTHWRIKTHIAISHLDANKISNIVADMRKVLAKNPHIEQQRLHRRIFLEFINTENQAFMILVSCFVRTSHFEEYLCVKEAVLLDLLRVISHHRARLATPIRTVQKMYSDTDLENVPFADAIFTRSQAPLKRQLYLIEPPSRMNGEDKMKGRPAPRVNEEQPSKAASGPGQKAAGSVPEVSNAEDKQQVVAEIGDRPLISEGPVESQSEDRQPQTKGKLGDSISGQMKLTAPNSSAKSVLEGTDSARLNSKSSKTTDAAMDKPIINSLATNGEQGDAVTPPATRSSFEDNIVLGVALDGAKRTLPIEEGVIPGLPPTTEIKELAAASRKLGRDKKDVQTPPIGGTPADQRDQER